MNNVHEYGSELENHSVRRLLFKNVFYIFDLLISLMYQFDRRIQLHSKKK